MKTNHAQYLPVYYLKSESILLYTQRNSFLTLRSCEDRLKFFLCQWDSTLILLSVLHNLAAFLCLCAFLEKYMFLWFSLKEVFLITKQDELNSLFCRQFYVDFSGLSFKYDVKSNGRIEFQF